MAVRKNSVAAFLIPLALILTSMGVAHEGGKHFKGSVKSFDAANLTIVTTTNETVTLKLLPTTKFVKGTQPGSLHDLKEGERVVIHAKQNGSSLEAQEVHFGASSAKR